MPFPEKRNGIFLCWTKGLMRFDQLFSLLEIGTSDLDEVQASGPILSGKLNQLMSNLSLGILLINQLADSIKNADL